MADRLKDTTSNWERRLLAIIDDQKKNIAFGSISIDLKITNDKVVLVELKGITKTFKMDS